MIKVLLISTALSLCIFRSAASQADASFTFESVSTLDEMAVLIQAKLPLGSSRIDVRHLFVDAGKATLTLKADDANVEKYLYDIDLCHYYIWRWNISADYDANNQLRQAYINGNIVFPDGNPKKTVPKQAEKGKKAAIYRAQRPRPEAYKGEKSLGFILFDRDSDNKTTDDQALIGAGPSRANPINMGKLITYQDVEPWRSIFDVDAADQIMPYQGDCNAVDAYYKKEAKPPV
ncbi:MAG: hypothetical protein WC782_16675 [Methylococcaceae bacterium]